MEASLKVNWQQQMQVNYKYGAGDQVPYIAKCISVSATSNI